MQLHTQSNSFLLLPCPSIKVQKKSVLFLAKTALKSCCWTLTHGHPSGFWQKEYLKKGPGPLRINVTWIATGLMSVWFKTGEWHSTL
jgi:hypothetical protein